MKQQHSPEPKKPVTILLVEDDANDVKLLTKELDKHFRASVQRVQTEEEFRNALEAGDPDFILSDYTLPTFDGMRALMIRMEKAPNVPFILVTGSMNEATAVECMKAGADDYVIKEHLHRLISAMNSALEKNFLLRQKLEIERALFKSEARFRRALDNSPVMVFNQDRDLRYTWIYHPHEFFEGKISVGMTEEDIFPAEDAATVRKIKQQAMDAGTILRQEVTLTVGSGLWYIDLTVEPIRGRNNAVEGVTCVSIDITQKKVTEGKLRLHTTALHSAANAVVITDVTGNIISVNPAFTELTGYSEEEVLGKKPSILKSGMQSSDFYKTMWDTISGGDVWRNEVVNKRKDGTLYTEDMTITPVFDDHNVITNYIAIKQDVSERIRAMERIEQQARLLDEAHDAIILRDLDNKILFWNKGAEKIYGWTKEEVIGKDSRLIFDAAILPSAGKNIDVSDERTLNQELVHSTKSGEKITVQTRASVLKDASGAPMSILTINTDITEQKNLESQFMRTQRLDSLGTLAGGIAHDLNNVLAPILLSIEVLKRTYVNEASQKMLTAAESSARRGADIVKQILSFTRGLESKKTVIQTRHLINEMVSVFRETFPRSITIVTTVPKNLRPIIGDPTHFHQMILNLCVNARDAMPHGGTLSITAENKKIDDHYAKMNIQARPGMFVMYSIADTGIGMTPDIMDKMFDPFFTTKGIGQGTGLGLSTVHTIVKNHEGFFDVKSEPGKGTIFNIFLPATELTDVLREEMTTREQLRGNGELILIVDDESSVCEVTKQTLESFNYTVLTASQGAEALAMFANKQKEIVLVITDIMMPVMDGPHLILAIKRMNPLIKIIGSSGLIEKSSYSKSELAVDDFLLKPYSADDLLLMIKKVLYPKK